jgi:hypothetical protein
MRSAIGSKRSHPVDPVQQITMFEQRRDGGDAGPPDAQHRQAATLLRTRPGGLRFGSAISLYWRRSPPAPAAPRVTFPARMSGLRPRAPRRSEAKG